MIRGAYPFILNVKDPSFDQLISKMISADPNHESRSLPRKVRGRITPSLSNLIFIYLLFMLVQHREYAGWLHQGLH